MTSTDTGDGAYRVPYIDFLPDNAAEVLAKFPAMAARCADCAYTNGTGANLHPITSRIARECAEARCAFWCHKTVNADGIPTHLCAGWRDVITDAEFALEARSTAPSAPDGEGAQHVGEANGKPTEPNTQGAQ